MMEGLFLRVFTVSAAVSLVLLPLLLLRGWLEKKYAPQTRWALWLAVALVLLAAPWLPKPQAPVVVEAPAYQVSIPGAVLRPQQREAAPVRPAAPTEAPAVHGGRAPGQGVSAVPAAPSAPEEPVAAQWTEGARSRSVSLAALAAGVWLAGVALILLWQGVRYLLFRRRLLSGARQVTGLEEYALELGLSRVAFYQGKDLPGPMTMGLFHPVVLLPGAGLAPAALRHELYHIKRRDVAYKTFLLLACALHWFNPLAWAMLRRAGRDVEACCDAAVVAGRDSGYRRSYGELLLSAAAEEKYSPFATSFGGGKEQMKSRLAQLFRPGKKSRALVCVLLAAALLLSGLVACREKGELADGLYCATAADVLGSYPVGEAGAEGEDYGSIRLSLLEYSEEKGPHGKPLGEYTLPLSAELTLRGGWDPGEKGTQDWQERVAEFLEWPIRRNSIPVGVEYLVLERAGGEITRMFWIEWPRDDTLYTNETYGFTLQLPESWAGQYQAVDRGGDVVTFYQEGGMDPADPAAGAVMDLIVTTREGFNELYGDKDLDGIYAGGGPRIIVLGEKEGRLVYLHIDPLPEGKDEAYITMWETVVQLSAHNFAWIEDGTAQPLTEAAMPTLDYYDPERSFLLYHTADTVYFHYGDQWSSHQADRSAGRVIGRCGVSRDGKTAYLSEALDDGTGREEKFYAWDVEGWTLTEAASIPDGAGPMPSLSPEAVMSAGLAQPEGLGSNAIETADGARAMLVIDQRVGTTLEYLELLVLKDGEAEYRFLTPERIDAPRVYVEPEWGFSLTLPENMAGNYVVLRGARNWNFYSKDLYPQGGYIFSLWAEEPEEHRALQESYSYDDWPWIEFGEKNGICYSATCWREDYTTPGERENETYMAMREAAWHMMEGDLDLSGVTRSSGYLWPLPDLESRTVLWEGDNTLRLAVPEGAEVRSIAEGEAVWRGAHPVTGLETLVIAYPGGRFGCYGNLEYSQVDVGEQVKRGQALGYARAENGQRWVSFTLLEGEGSWNDARPVDPFGNISYRSYDYQTITREELDFVGDSDIRELLQAARRGEVAFYHTERQEYCYADALPADNGAKVAVYRWTQADLDGDRIPEIVLWLQRGENGDPYQLGSIVLHYENGAVCGYPKSLRALNPEDLKQDGTYGWSSGASVWGWGRMDFSDGGATRNLTWREGEKYYVAGSPAAAEDFEAAYAQRQKEQNVTWYERNGNGVFDLRVGEDRKLTVQLVSDVPGQDYFWVRQIQVYEGGELLQSIATADLFPPDYPWDSCFVNRGYAVGEPKVMDLNFDGREDFGLLAVATYSKNVPYNYFLWNEEKGEFEYSFTLLSEVEADQARKELVETEYGTAGDIENRYRFDSSGALGRIK